MIEVKLFAQGWPWLGRWRQFCPLLCIKRAQPYALDIEEPHDPSSAHAKFGSRPFLNIFNCSAASLTLSSLWQLTCSSSNEITYAKYETKRQKNVRAYRRNLESSWLRFDRHRICLHIYSTWWFCRLIARFPSPVFHHSFMTPSKQASKQAINLKLPDQDE